MTQKLIRAADLFCGAGGTSTGLLKAIRELKYTADLLAINHWDIAIATHTANHEKVRHLCQNLDKVDPEELIPSGRLDLLVASPECKHHSNARGGKPRSDQKRADAWLLMRWIEKLYVKNLLVENVREFIDWGPLGANGQPLKKYKGTYFQQFIDTLKINYHVEYKVLNCADYGDPTTRERFFLMARRKTFTRFNWPAQTHASPAVIQKQIEQPTLFISRRRLKPWVPARDIIDWSLPGKSIFGRKRPLSPNTMMRIFAGLKKYSGIEFVMATGGPSGQMNPRVVDLPLKTVMPNSRMNVIQPYLTNMKGQSIGRSIDGPTFSQTGKPHQYLCEPVLLNMKGKDGQPFLTSYHGSHKGHRSTNAPTFTQCAGGNHQGLIETDLTPFIAKTHHGGGKDGARRHHPVDKTFPTITSFDAWALIEPFFIQFFGERKGQKARTRGTDQPVWTITGQRTPALIQPFLTSYHGSHKGKDDGHRRAKSLGEPLPAQDTSNRFGLVEGEAFLVKSYTGSDAASLDEPCPSITANFEHLALVQPFLAKIEDGTGNERFGIVIPQLGAILDIRFRMLQPHELALAMGFPKSYSFSGTREDKVMQIGNAVPVQTAKALCKALLTEPVRKSKPRELKKAA